MSKTHSTRKVVVAGLVVDHDRLLISQRLPTQTFPLQWEFPGGKVEPSESPESALKRELFEELGIEVQVDRVWDVLFHPYPEFDLMMLMYPCVIVAGRPRCKEVSDMAWVLPAELGQYDILAADAPIVARLVREGVPVLGPANAK